MALLSLLLPRRQTHAGLALLVLIIFLAWLSLHHDGRSPSSWTRSTTQSPTFQEAPPRPQYLRLVYTQREPDAVFCRSLFSALALGYPVPYLTGWFQDPASPSVAADQALDILRYLAHIDKSLDDDLTVLTTRPGIWFQLRPSVLVSRYLALTSAPSDIVLASASPSAQGVVLIGPVASLRSLFEHVAYGIRALNPAQKNAGSVQLHDLVMAASRASRHDVVLDAHAQLLSSSWDAPAARGANALPADIGSSDAPLTTPGRRSFHGVAAPGLDRLLGLRWPDAHLAADTGTGAIPAALDVGAGEPTQVDALWRRLWTFDILRELMSVQALAHTGPVARARRPGGEAREWWPYPAYGRGADSVLVEGREALPLEGICSGFGDDAFRDGLAWTTVGRGSLFDG